MHSTYNIRSEEFPLRCWTGSLPLQCASSHSDSVPKCLDQAHYKLMSCARKIPPFCGIQGKTCTTQTLHVCKTSFWKRIKVFLFNKKCYFFKNGYIFVDHFLLKRNNFQFFFNKNCYFFKNGNIFVDHPVFWRISTTLKTLCKHSQTSTVFLFRSSFGLHNKTTCKKWLHNLLFHLHWIKKL